MITKIETYSVIIFRLDISFEFVLVISIQFSVTVVN